ncbi:cytochrome P450 [Nocardia colli]|uniref:Cytochrome P450 n=1 Tax=Nocardia colli TaxID=2545717 RepID=A0A5N0DX72_9NOCA|nr:cytochrome P450 [Nocardia colli]KAA8880615.1 cytochrome P450 [Nocardia colli]
MTNVTIGPSEALGALFTASGKSNPYPLYTALRELGPVISLGPKLVFVLGYAECAAALREPGLLVTDAARHRKSGMIEHSSWQCFTKIMMFSNEPDHERLRGFSRWAYSPQRVSALRPVVERWAGELAERLADRPTDTVDLVEEFTFRLAVSVTSEIYGIPEPDRMPLHGAVTAATTAFEPISDLGDLAPGDAGMDVLVAYLTDLVHRRRAEPGDDLTTAMLHDCDATGTITEDELVAGLVMFLIAGTQSPSDLLGNGIRLALADPAAFAAAGIADFVTEVLRFEPPIHALTRVAAHDLTVSGTTVRAGAQVLLVLAAANRDPARYTDPDRFEPQRTANRPIAFGLGVHHCLGAGLARMQTEVALPILLQRFPDMTLAGDPPYREQLVQRGPERLLVRPGRYEVRESDCG